MLGGGEFGSAFVTRFLAGADPLTGNKLANTLHGGTGNDRLIGAGGSDLIDGGSGEDVSVYREMARAGYHVSRSSNGTVIVTTRGGTVDRDTGVESLDFTDGTLSTVALRTDEGIAFWGETLG